MHPTATRLLLFAASLSAGIGAGWGLRQGKAGGPSTTSTASSPEASGPAPAPGSQPAEPFSMDRFRAASGLPMHRMLARVLPTADAALVRSLAEHLATRPEFPLDPVWQALLGRWVQLDAPAALAWARTVEGKELAKIAIRAWAEADLEAALAGVNPAGTEEWGILCTKMAETDPKRAWRMMSEIERGQPVFTGSFSNLYSFGLLYAKSDPLAALADLKAHYSYTDFIAWQRVATGWALKDPDGCRDWLAGLQPPFKGYAINGLQEAAEENPAAVAKVLGAVLLTDETRDLFLLLSANWAKQDAPAALAWVKHSFPEGPLRNRALSNIALALAGKDLSGALAIMDSLGWDDGTPWRSSRYITGKGESAHGGNWIDDCILGGGAGESANSSIIAQLGRTNPELALRYVEKTDPARQPRLLLSFIPQWFSREPEAATRWLEALPPDKFGAPLLTRLLLYSRSLEPDAARTWAQRLPPGPLQQALAGISVDEATLENPAAAVEAVPYTDAASRDAALDKIIRHWSTTDPQSALERLVREPTPLPDTCQAVVEQWTLHDPTAASTWVASQAPGPNRDAAIKGLTTSLTDDDAQPDFPAALMWSLSITDPGGRLKTAQTILKNWDSSGPDAAEMRATLENTGALPEPERQILLQLLNP